MIVHLNERVLKGYIDRGAWPDRDVDPRQKRIIRIRTLEGNVEGVSLDEAKAVFFVRSFNAAPQEPLRFHDNAPPPDSLWARLTFRDGEVIEGMIQNGRRFLLDPGFLVTPTDPTGNNLLIYVLKTNILNFQVLGLRHKARQKFFSLTPATGATQAEA